MAGYVSSDVGRVSVVHWHDFADLAYVLSVFWIPSHTIGNLNDSHTSWFSGLIWWNVGHVIVVRRCEWYAVREPIKFRASSSEAIATATRVQEKHCHVSEFDHDLLLTRLRSTLYLEKKAEFQATYNIFKSTIVVLWETIYQEIRLIIRRTYIPMLCIGETIACAVQSRSCAVRFLILYYSVWANSFSLWSGFAQRANVDHCKTDLCLKYRKINENNMLFYSF